MSKGPGPLAHIPLALANTIRKIGGKGKPRIINEAARVEPTKAAQVVCGLCTPSQTCKHCRNWTKIAQRWLDRQNRKRQRRAERAAKAVPA